MIAGQLDAFVDRVERDWQRLEYDERAFATLAHERLAEFDAAAGWSVATLLDHLIGPSREPRGFHGAPEALPLVSRARFELYAHVWLDSVAPAHDHGWSGAFRILAGRSLNVYFRFTEQGRSNADLRWGALTRERVEVHRAGETVAVEAGPRFIHGLAYVERGGLALSLRSKRREQPSLTYFRPGLALAEDARDSDVRARLAALELARGLDEALYRRLFEALAQTGDRLALVFALQRASARGWGIPATVAELGQRRFGPDFASALAAMTDVGLTEQLVALRRELDEPELRSFLAALYFSDDRSALLEALAVTDPDGAPWARIGRSLLRLLVDDDDGAVEIPDFFVDAFAGVARGWEPCELRERLRSAGHAPTDGQLEFLESARAAMREAPLYRCLCE